VCKYRLTSRRSGECKLCLNTRVHHQRLAFRQCCVQTKSTYAFLWLARVFYVFLLDLSSNLRHEKLSLNCQVFDAFSLGDTNFVPCKDLVTSLSAHGKPLPFGLDSRDLPKRLYHLAGPRVHICILHLNS